MLPGWHALLTSTYVYSKSHEWSSWRIVRKEVPRLICFEYNAYCISLVVYSNRPCVTKVTQRTWKLLHAVSQYHMILTRTCQTYIINTMAADDLASFVARSSAAMILTGHMFLHSRYHSCSWPGSLCRQVISSHGIDWAYIFTYKVNTMAADDLAPCITRSSAAMVLTGHLYSYTKSISWLLMTWLLVSPGHQ